METKITLRSLGNSNLMVTPIGLGTWQFSRNQGLAGKFWPDMEDDVINGIVKASLKGGINWFDTAEVYGNGASEKALSTALTINGKKPGEVIIATKWWPALRRASNILSTIDKRLKALDPFPIDLYQIHQPFGFSGEKAEMAAMAKLVKDHKIKYVGVSNFPARRMRSAWEALQKEGISLISNQVRYNLIDRKIETNGILNTAKELGISIISYSPLAQGILTGKFHADPDLVKKAGKRKLTSYFMPSTMDKCKPLITSLKILAEKYSVTPSQIALNWLINFQGDSIVAIPGATKESHAKENTGAMKFIMDPEDMALLDQKSEMFK
ncbi:MAG: aldo/keto reductase [Bacteroidota bacterium]|nr:aldo/keto reductase [Bacteroidota bacterium]